MVNTFTLLVPEFFKTHAHALAVAPVVITSSTNMTVPIRLRFLRSVKAPFMFANRLLRDK